jgi:CheY-like chemotaxis protein
LKADGLQTWEMPVAALFGSRDAGPRMLIADDDPSVVRSLAERCARMGFDVETVCNGIQAALRASRRHPDILLIDVNMPEVDGLTVCAHLLQPGKESLNVIVISGSRNPGPTGRSEALGARYVRKDASFWSSLEGALAGMFPDMAGRIRETGEHSAAGEVRQRPSVLLVDDDSDIYRFLDGEFENRGVELLYACDASQGFRIACESEPNAIVTDYFMPGGDAQYLLTRLRSAAATGKIPVIVQTGRRLSEATARMLGQQIGGQPGAAAVLKKSNDTRELFTALERFCGFERESAVSVHGPGGAEDGSGRRTAPPAVYRGAPANPG